MRGESGLDGGIEGVDWLTSVVKSVVVVSASLGVEGRVFSSL